MKRIQVLVFVLLSAIAAFAQGGVSRSVAATQAPGNLVRVLPFAPVVVCGYPPSGGAPCNNFATTYTSPTLLSACSVSLQVVSPGTSTCVGTADGAGNFEFYAAAPGSYSYYFNNGTAWQGPFTAVFSGGGGGGGGGGLNPGLANQMVTYLTPGTQGSPDPLFTDNQSTQTLSYGGTGGFALTPVGPLVWHSPGGACPTPATTDIFLGFCGGDLQKSKGLAGFFPLLDASGISGNTINSGFVSQAFLDPSLDSRYFQTALATGNTTSALTAAPDVATAAAHTGTCTDASGTGTITTIGCPAGSGAANTSLSNVSGVTALPSNITFAAGFGTISTSTNGDLPLLPNGTGADVMQPGSVSNPGVRFLGDAVGGIAPWNGFYYQGTPGVWCYETGGASAKYCWKSNAGSVISSTLGYGIGSSTQATSSPDICLVRVSANLFGIGSTCSITDFTGSLKLTNLTVLGSCTGCGTNSLPASVIFIPAGSSSATVQAFFSGASAGSTIWMTGGYTACGLTLSVSGVTLQGLNWSGTTIQCATAASPVLTVSGSGDVVRGITFQHITNSPTAGGDGLVVTPGTSRVRIEGTRANFNYNGYNLGYTDYGWFNGNLSELNNNHGVIVVATNGHAVYQWQFSQNLMQQNLGNGFDFTMGGGITSLQGTCPFFSDWNTAYGNAGYGFNISASAATTSGIADCWFANTLATANNNSGLHIDSGPNGGRNEQVTGGYFEQSGLYSGIAGFSSASQTATNVGYGIEITSSCDSTIGPNITGAILWQNAYSGGISACPTTTWTGISAYGNGNASASVQTEAGITVNADNTTIVSGNFKIASTQTSGVYVSGGDYPGIVGINCLGASAPCVTVGSQPTHGFIETLGNVSYHQQNAAPTGACHNGDVWTRTDTTGGIYLCVNAAWVAH